MKYIGNKSRIAKDIVPIIQKYIDDNDIKSYLEPFCGGGNIIDKIRCERKIGCDIHEYLIELLNYIKQDIIEFPTDITYEDYNHVKNNKSNYQKMVRSLCSILWFIWWKIREWICKRIYK